MSHSASTGQLSAPFEEPRLRPTVSWPTTMIAGQRHLVSVDLALVNRDGTPAQWPLPGEEEYTYTCLLDGGGVFELWAVRDATVVLHRFGDSYEPAQFVVIPTKKTPGEQSLWLTIINQWGVSVGEYPLKVDVRVPVGQMDTVPDVPDVHVPAEMLPVSDSAGGDRDQYVEFADALASDYETTVDIPYQEFYEVLPGRGIGDESPQPVGLAPLGPTVADYVRPSDDYLPETDYSPETKPPLIEPTRRDGDLAPRTEPLVPRRREGARPAVRLRERYNVTGLRRSPTGSLHWDLVPLFSSGASAGDRVTFTARCPPSDEHGTVFAVMADGADAVPELRSVQSAKIPPGIYRVTAELLYPRPGLVQFHGLPAMPREDPRPWQEISAAVPSRLPSGSGPAHLIVALEISGPDNQIVEERIESVRRLILHVAAEARDFVCYSVITYGPHSINPNNREYPEVPVMTLAWAETADDALTVLDRLRRRGVASFGYEYAAQLECVLTDLDKNLTGQEGRPVIVTVGARPPHPPRVDPVTRIIPCWRRNDWTVPMSRLRSRYTGITFGSIRDAGRADQLWQLLGTNATTVDDYFAPGFAQALGLTATSARPIALPMFAR